MKMTKEFCPSAAVRAQINEAGSSHCGQEFDPRNLLDAELWMGQWAALWLGVPGG